MIACSALRRAYRQILESGRTIDSDNEWQHDDLKKGCDNLNVRFVLLNASEEIVAERLQCRKNHFMNPTLLQSQLSTLEIPSPEENVVVVNVDVHRSVRDIVALIEKEVSRIEC